MYLMTSGIVRGSRVIETAHPGQAPWLPLARAVLRQEVLVRNMEPPTGRVQERSKGELYAQPPPRILLFGVHLG